MCHSAHICVIVHIYVMYWNKNLNQKTYWNFPCSTGHGGHGFTPECPESDQRLLTDPQSTECSSTLAQWLCVVRRSRQCISHLSIVLVLRPCAPVQTCQEKTLVSLDPEKSYVNIFATGNEQWGILREHICVITHIYVHIWAYNEPRRQYMCESFELSVRLLDPHICDLITHICAQPKARIRVN